MMKRARRIFKNSTLKQVNHLVSIVGFDGAWTVFNGLEEGKSAETVMRDLQPFFDRYVAAHGEEKHTRRDFYWRLDRGEV